MTTNINEAPSRQQTTDPSTTACSVFDLESMLADIKNQDAWKKGDRSARTLIKDHRQRITLVALRKGTKVPAHQANGAISVQMVEGRMKFITPLRTALLDKGQVLTLQSKIQHSMEAPEDAAFLLTLSLDVDEPTHPAVATSAIGRIGDAQPRPGVQPEPARVGARSTKRPAASDFASESRRLLPADGKPVRTLGEYEAAGGLAGLRRALTMSPDQIVEDLNRSGLRGRGGAGFPTGMKWTGVIRGGRGKRYVCCNGAEGEPGTFKDRYLMSANPYLTLEGLAIAAHAVDAERIFICIKRSFEQVAERLKHAIKELNEAKLFPDGRALNIELVLGPEEYLLGEEKALLEVVEGNLPLPRWLAPYIEGLFRKPLQDNPTLVNNAETLANVALIMRHGPEWFRQTGTPDSPGTMIFTVCGDVARPGCYELPLGRSMRDLVENVAGGIREGHSLKAIFPGVSNGVLTPGHLDVSLDFDNMRAVGSGLGSGGFIVYDESVCIVRAAAMVSRFLYVESCGQCPPCKFSSGEITEHLKKIDEGRGTPADIETILARCATVDQGNRCALPTGEHLVIESLVNRFSEEFLAHCGSACPHPRDLQLPKLTAFNEQSRTFAYDDHQQFKQPDWSYVKTNSFA